MIPPARNHSLLLVACTAFSHRPINRPNPVQSSSGAELPELWIPRSHTRIAILSTSTSCCRIPRCRTHPDSASTCTTTLRDYLRPKPGRRSRCGPASCCGPPAATRLFPLSPSRLPPIPWRPHLSRASQRTVPRVRRRRRDARRRLHDTFDGRSLPASSSYTLIRVGVALIMFGCAAGHCGGQLPQQRVAHHLVEHRGGDALLVGLRRGARPPLRVTRGRLCVLT